MIDTGKVRVALARQGWKMVVEHWRMPEALLRGPLGRAGGVRAWPETWTASSWEGGPTPASGPAPDLVVLVKLPS